MPQRRIVVYVPELFRETGGIQNFSRTLIAACDQILGRPVAVLSRNDRRSDLPPDFTAGRDVQCVGMLPANARPPGLVAASLQHRRDFVLTTHPNFTPWLRLLKRLGGGQYMTVAHGIEVWGDWSSSLTRGMAAASRILAVSRYTGDSVRAQLKQRCPPIDIFPNAVDTTRFVPGPRFNEIRRRLDISEQAMVMLTVARVAKSEERKGYRQILEMMPRLTSEFPELVWVLGGKGNDLDDVRAAAESLGVTAACRFPGFVSDADLPALYQAADFFVLPSRKEGFGIVFLEALASGIPVIGGNQDGSVDALDHGRLGLLINPDDEVELMQAIRSAASRELPAHLADSQALRRECAAKFGFDAFRDRLQAILQQMGWIE